LFKIFKNCSKLSKIWANQLDSSQYRRILIKNVKNPFQNFQNSCRLFKIRSKSSKTCPNYEFSFKTLVILFEILNFWPS
jgi:hypothetical protein